MSSEKDQIESSVVSDGSPESTGVVRDNRLVGIMQLLATEIPSRLRDVRFPIVFVDMGYVDEGSRRIFKVGVMDADAFTGLQSRYGIHRFQAQFSSAEIQRLSLEVLGLQGQDAAL